MSDIILGPAFAYRGFSFLYRQTYRWLVHIFKQNIGFQLLNGHDQIYRGLNSVIYDRALSQI